MPDTCAVSGSIRDIGFQPEEGAIVRFTLSGSKAVRQSDSLVVPDFVEATTDANGDFTRNLIPNRYTVEIITPSGGFSAPIRITVPDAASAILAQIINLPPPASLNAAEQAVLDAQAARDAANAHAVATAADRVATGEDRTQTGLDAVDTAADRVATGQDRAAAAQSASDAFTHASAAEAAKTGAEGAQTGAEAARTGAEDARDSASGHRLNAQNAETAAEAAQAATEAARDTTLAARDDTQLAEIGAKSARDDAALSAASTSSAAADAANSKAAAASEAGNAAESASEAGLSRMEAAASAQQTALDRQQTGADRSAASDSADAAAGSASASSGFASAASDSAAAAENWAEAPEDTEVEPGKFSALHHSEKASDARAAAEAVVPSLGAQLGTLAAALGQVSREQPAVRQEAQDAVASVGGISSAAFFALQIASQAADQINGGQAALRGGTLDDPALRIGTVGLYSSAADTLSIAIAGTEVARIDASGITIFGTITEA